MAHCCSPPAWSPASGSTSDSSGCRTFIEDIPTSTRVEPEPAPTLELGQREAGGGKVEQQGERSWRLSLPAGPGKTYRWAQIDDYYGLPRARFAWNPPAVLTVRARVSAPDPPGTWGFGFWNDPFSAGLGLGGMARRTPVLPNTAWFFFASPPNFLSLRDDLPADGLLAATFRSDRLPTPLLVLGAAALPLLAVRPAARLLRRLGRRFVAQSAARLEIDPTLWHAYQIAWTPRQTTFSVDDAVVCSTQISPPGPLGFVLWIDNQYAAFPPSGRVSLGSLLTPAPAWLEIDALEIHPA